MQASMQDSRAPKGLLGDGKRDEPHIPFRAFVRNRAVQALCFTHFANNWWVPTEGGGPSGRWWRGGPLVGAHRGGGAPLVGGWQGVPFWWVPDPVHRLHGRAGRQS